MSSGLFNNTITYKLLTYKSYVCVCVRARSRMYKWNLELNNPQGWVCYFTK